MNLVKPAYFDRIQKESEENWDFLEKNQKMAGPYWLLLEQLDSPRHVVSELLQNADDAEATEVSINIVNGVFNFTHNGHDFIEEEFSSICNFGFSNKRLLHTIGFRGIGFKSTFSLGPTVELNTPTLSVAFHKQRFTYPVWTDRGLPENGYTQIVVKIIDQKTEEEIISSMDSWLKSPLSLLFFNNVRKLQIGGEELHWENISSGPVENSTWMGLKGTQTSYLFVRSREEPFPREAIAEIRENRRLLETDKTDLPPCKVEIAIGARGEIFSVLPTGVATSFTFAMNAPFMQDPARQSIKNPDFSPTNRWLLNRIGQLAASVMLEWLNREDLPLEERVKAYGVLPGLADPENLIQSTCTKVIKEALKNRIEGLPFVLSEDGTLAVTGKCASVPSIFWKIWTREQIISIIGRPLISRNINADYRHKLSILGAIGIYSGDDIKALLVKTNPPKPDNHAALLELWNYVGKWGYFQVSDKYFNRKDICVFPVRGSSALYAAKSIIRIGEKKVQISDEDWNLLINRFRVMDTDFLSYIKTQKQISLENKNLQLSEKISTVEGLIRDVELEDPTRFDDLIDIFAKSVFNKIPPNLDEGIKVAQLAAKFKIKNQGSIRFWTMDGKIHYVSSNWPSSDAPIIDITGTLCEFIPPSLRNQFLLHSNYSKNFISCTKEEWFAWIQSGNSGVSTRIPATEKRIDIIGKTDFESQVRARGYIGNLVYHYVTHTFRILDFDFDQDFWNYWETYAKQDDSYWGRLLNFYLCDSKSFTEIRAGAFHVSTSLRSCIDGPISPSWVLKFQKLKCLPDTSGQYHYPDEMLRRTKETEPLLDLEPFVDFNIDKPDLYPLLDLLGVRIKPSGPKQVLTRLRQLSQSQNLPLNGIIKIYEQLDSLFGNCSTSDQQEIRDLLRNEKMIYAEDCSWQTAKTIFVNADENDVPGAALVHPAVRHLSLWLKVGVHDRPTVDLAILWLEKIPRGEKISKTDSSRVHSLLKRHPSRIWVECGSWLNLCGEWVAVHDLQYAATKHISKGKYFKWVEAKTADFSMILAETIATPEFSSLPELTSKLEKRVDYSAPHGQHVRFDSFVYLGRLLMRIQLKDEKIMRAVQEQAERLSKTAGVQIEEIITTPYLNGEPAGPREYETIAWVGQILYFIDFSSAKFTKQIIDKVASEFGWSEMRDILAYCYDRSEHAISTYLEGNYVLSAEDAFALQKSSQEDQTEKHDSAKDGLSPQADKQDQGSPKGEEKAAAADDDSKKGEDDDVDADDKIFTNDNDTDEDDDDDDDDNQPDNKTGSKSKRSTSTPIIERFALAHGFHRNGNQQYVHPDGRFLRKSEGILHWEMISSKDNSIQRFWVRDHCLESKPLEIPTEVWHILDTYPSESLLLLKDINNDPITYSGSQLKILKAEGRLTLHSAAYRIVLDTN